MTHRSAAGRTAAVAVLLGVLGVVAAAVAFGASTPSTPTILTAPANPTNSQVGTFTFSAPPAGVANECKLDAAALFSACSSPYSTWTLSAGSHTFQVRARNIGDGKTSSPAPYTWVIDLTPPARPTVTFGPTPLPGWSTSASSQFSFTGESGAAFLCSLDGGADTPCPSGVSYTVAQQVTQTFSVKARDAAGNLGLASTPVYQWRVDTVAPPAPVLVVKPDDPNGDGLADFTWTESEAGVSFTCRIENLAFQSCTSPYHRIVDVSNDGTHQFDVRAYDAAGNFSTTSYSWKVLHGVRLTITGTATGLLYPGALPAKKIDVVFDNPNNFPVYVNALTVAATGATGCAAANFYVEQADIDATAAKRILVPANGTTHVPEGRRPKILMRDLPLAQNNPSSGQYNCAGKQIALTYYAGSVTK